jgi:FtsP/CotA-like multicopper oxidase with cupredoxin domain
MFNKAFAMPLRRSVGAVSVIIASLAASAFAAMAQTTTSSSTLGNAAGVTSSTAVPPVAPVANACQRFAAGSVVQQPPALFSENGVLNVSFSYQTPPVLDSFGRQQFCFMTPDGLENPTLHVNPGDTLNITVTNNTPPVPTAAGETVTTELINPPNCGDTTEIAQNELIASAIPANAVVNIVPPTGGTMNIHYHGTNTSPACHGDNVVKTLINPGSTFSYSVMFPANEPPGLYWYHPHVHGLAEAAVQGGASGAIVVEGINNVQPATAGLRQRILIIRDQPTKQGLTESPGGTEGGIPQVDLTVNNVPLDTCTNTGTTGTFCPNIPTGATTYTPAVIQMAPGSQEFWRVSNSASDPILDLQVRFDGVAQTIQIVGIDGVPVNSQDGTQPGQLIAVTHFRLPPASRVEFLVNAPPSTVQVAQLVTQNIITGPNGDDDPTRPLLTMQLAPATVPSAAAPASTGDNTVPAFTALNTSQQLFGGISNVTPAVTRTVYFEENESGIEFFINASGCVTAAGAQCATQVTNGVPIDTPFDANNPPSIITTQGTVEKWIIQNHARENHEFHQHQIHFMVLSQDNFGINCEMINGINQCSQPAPAINGQFLDMVEVPFCGGPASTDGVHACLSNPDDLTSPPAIPYPQVQALLDFRGMDIGDFVFHCHILGHEDLGMMAIERVCPSTGCATTSNKTTSN